MNPYHKFYKTINNKYKLRVIHQDNVLTQSVLSAKGFLAKYSIPVLDHLHYLQDTAPSDFHLFPKVKSALKGTQFKCVEVVKEKRTRTLKELTGDVQHCFKQ